jgi:hypothetical protein
MIADLLIAFATSLFMISLVPKLIKNNRLRHITSQSLLANEIHSTACIIMIIGLLLVNCWISIIVTIIELILCIIIILQIRYYNPKKFEYKLDMIKYTIKVIEYVREKIKTLFST